MNKRPASRSIVAPVRFTWCLALFMLCLVLPGPLGGLTALASASELLTQAVIRIPSGGFILPGEAITGSVDARVILPGNGTRAATRSETNGILHVGELRVPIENGLFVLPSVPAGQTMLQAFGPLGAGAEIGRVHLIVPAAPAPVPVEASGPGTTSELAAPEAPPPPTGPWRVPLAVLPHDRILVRGPFAGAGDSPRLRISGADCLLVWESPRGALFRGPEADDAGSAGSDGNELELSIAGQAAARGTIYLPRARFALPDPPEVSGRGDVISLSADVSGLPPAPETTPSDGAIAEVVFLNLDPAVLVSLWSKSPGAHDLEDRLTVPIRPGLVSADGTFLVRATGRGRAKGPVRVDGALILSPDLSGALQPLVPVSQAIPWPLSPVVP